MMSCLPLVLSLYLFDPTLTDLRPIFPDAELVDDGETSLVHRQRVRTTPGSALGVWLLLGYVFFCFG